MVLDAHGLARPAHEARAGAVVEVDVRHLHVGWQRRRVDREVVVLRAYLDAACAAAPQLQPYQNERYCHAADIAGDRHRGRGLLIEYMTLRW